jgi:8-oxo-dGTP diphosphatase
MKVRNNNDKENCIMPHYEVVAAVITRSSENGITEIFCAQRPGPKPGKAPNETNYKWEFPGGKIEPGETRQQALEREIREEFGTEIKGGAFITTVEHVYKSFGITMHAFYCTVLSGSLTLKEHLGSKWLPRSELEQVDWAAADIVVMKAVLAGNNILA